MAMPAAAQDAIHNPQEYISGTLPVMYINTENNTPVTSREEYIVATYYLDNMGISTVKPIASAERPDSLLIRGRGYNTWKLAKKPYRIKLNKKTALMGMPKNKHFALLAHHDDYSYAYIMDECGFELSRRFGMAWTPEQHPVELVLNGDYVGLYFIATTVRVDKDRVNITEQTEGDTDPANITGGWLVEEDNQIEKEQFLYKLGRITYHNPEVLSREQRTYLKAFFNNVADAVTTEDRTDRSWENLIDIDTLARFYVINESLDDIESFSGSCWMHKQRGDSTKLIFGPVWDFGASMSRSLKNGFKKLYEDVPSYCDNRFLLQVLQFPHLQYMIRKVWTDNIDNAREGLYDQIYNWAMTFKEAREPDHARWSLNRPAPHHYYTKRYLTNMLARMDWLDNQWNLKLLYDVTGDGVIDVTDINYMITTLLGKTTEPTEKYLDVNFDGAVDVTDVSEIINHILKQTPPAQEE